MDVIIIKFARFQLQHVKHNESYETINSIRSKLCEREEFCTIAKCRNNINYI